ncbi:MAG: hypothetical protein AAGD38_04225 [Acidobacteriota bacterium]
MSEMAALAELANVDRADFEHAVEHTIMPMIVSLGVGTYWTHFKRLLDDDHDTPENLAALQWRQVMATLGHAAERVPLYRDRFAAAGVRVDELRDPRDLVTLPTIDKRTIVSAFPDQITDRDAERDHWRYRSTSGTAFRVMTVTDHDARQWRYALHLRSLHHAGGYRMGRPQMAIRTTACVEACSVDGNEEAMDADALPVERVWPPWGLAELTLQEQNLDPLAPRGVPIPPRRADDVLHRLDETRPAVLRGLPTYLLTLARRLAESGRHAPPIGRVIVQDALAPPALKAELAAAFQCPVHETWGSSELGSAAAEAELDGGLLVAPRCFLVEVIDRNGAHVAPGELGEIVVTATTNRAMPLIRYRLGDVGRLLPTVPGSIHGAPRLVIEGRVRECVDGPHGLVTPRAVYQALAPLLGAGWFQLRERNEHRYDLDMVPDPDGPPTHPDDIAAALAPLLGVAEIRVRKVRTIYPAESGKYLSILALDRDHAPRDV